MARPDEFIYLFACEVFFPPSCWRSSAAAADLLKDEKMCKQQEQYERFVHFFVCLSESKGHELKQKYFFFFTTIEKSENFRVRASTFCGAISDMFSGRRR